MKKKICSLLLLCVLYAGAGAAGAEGDARPASAVATGAAPRDAAAPGTADEYQIGAHDLLEVSVFQVQELSRTVRVNSQGAISLPLIGRVEAAGKTSHELETAIALKLAEGLLQDPQVSVFIKEFVSQRVTVEGAVVKAGIYPLTGKTSLLQAIAMASGVDQVANENEITVFRTGRDGAREALVFDLEAIRSGQAPDPAIKGNDVVVVGKSAGRAAVKGITDTLRGFLSFGTLR